MPNRHALLQRISSSLSINPSTEDSHFAIDTIKNVFWFCVIGLAALALQYFVHWTEQRGGSPVLVFLLTFLEYAVLIADVVWFISRLLVGTYKVILNTYHEIISAKTRLNGTATRSDSSRDQANEYRAEKLKTQETQSNDKINNFPESTVFFYERFCSAFPGVRGIEWFSAPDEAIARLSKLLEPPLELTSDKRSGTFNPIWWWRGGNLHIYKFEQIDNETVLLNCHELKINKIAAVNPDSYYRCFVYVETKPMEPTGLYSRTKEEIEQSVNIFGYCTEEYGLFKDKFKVSRAEYDDGAAKVNGSLVELQGEAQLRVRFITPYNIIIAAHNSPLNNSRFDQELKLLMNDLLTEKVTLEQVEEILSRLPKREPRG